MIRIYDGNNYARREMEVDVSGMTPRNILIDTFNCPDPVIWVWDAVDGSRARKQIFPGYKVGRTPPAVGIFDGFRMIQDVLKHSKAVQIVVPGFEADDVIATIARHYAGKGHQVGIFSADYDFHQLSSPNITIGAQLKKVVPHPKFVRLYKTCVGDTSDKIPGIPGFGEKTWAGNKLTDLLAVVTKWVTTLEVDEADFQLVSMPPRARKFVAEETALLKSYWDIIGFFDVPVPLIEQHTTVGVPNWPAADRLLKEFHL